MSLAYWKQTEQYGMPASAPSRSEFHWTWLTTRVGLAGFHESGSLPSCNGFWSTKLQSPGPWSHVSVSRWRDCLAATLAFQYGQRDATVAYIASVTFCALKGCCGRVQTAR
jgi:hypothetical protein